jgi:DNA-binding transcriptional MerR regulator
MTPSEVAKKCGVSADTIRYYEKEGVIPAAERNTNGYRHYPEHVVARVRIVRAALRLGFTIEEIATLLKERSRGSPPCKKARAMAAEKLETIEQQIAELQALRQDLKNILKDWDERLDNTPAGTPANLLDTLKGENDVHSDDSAVPSRRRLPDARRSHARG